MRLHTDKLSITDLYNALKAEQDAGRIAKTVGFKILTQHGSRSHATAFEVQLDSYDRVQGDGRKRGNSGSFGSADDGYYAATYDEWGWLIAALYKIDSNAVWGTVKYPQYMDRYDFNDKTGWTYAPEDLIKHLRDFGGDPFPYMNKNQVGRRGARSDDSVYGYRKAFPRTVEWVEKFSRGEVK